MENLNFELFLKGLNSYFEFTAVSGCYILKATISRWYLRLQDYYQKLFEDYSRIIVPSITASTIIDPLYLLFRKERFYLDSLAIEEKNYQLKEIEEDKKIHLNGTSETILHDYYFKKPLNPRKVFQINNVYRKEIYFRPFIRVAEIHFFENHAIFYKIKELIRDLIDSIKKYRKLFKRLRIPFIFVKRPSNEKFPGAKISIGFDTIINNRALQIASCHYLSDSFTKKSHIITNGRTPRSISFGISFERVALSCLYWSQRSPLTTIFTGQMIVIYCLKRDKKLIKFSKIFKTKIKYQDTPEVKKNLQNEIENKTWAVIFYYFQEKRNKEMTCYFFPDYRSFKIKDLKTVYLELLKLSNKRAKFNFKKHLYSLKDCQQILKKDNSLKLLGFTNKYAFIAKKY